MKQIVVMLTLWTLALGLCACSATQPKGAGEEPSQGPTWQEQYDLGSRYLSEGNYEEAIIAFTAAIEIDPKQAPAYAGRGDAYVLSGETETNLTAAKADYKKAIELDETNPEAYLGLADVYMRQGDAETARMILEQGLMVTGDARLQERLDELDEMERQEGRPEGASETVTAVGYVINNVDEYWDQWHSYVDQYPQVQTGEGYWAGSVCIRNCGIRFATTVNAKFNGNIITIQEAEAEGNSLQKLFGEEDPFYLLVNTDGTSGSMIGRRMELTGYFISREEPGELTGPEYNEVEGRDMYIYHPNGDYYFYLESYTLLD